MNADSSIATTGRYSRDLAADAVWTVVQWAVCGCVSVGGRGDRCLGENGSVVGSAALCIVEIAIDGMPAVAGLPPNVSDALVV